MLSTAPRKVELEDKMQEKIYKFIGRAGGVNIAIGVVTIALGVSAGVLLIVSGAKLLASRKGMIF